MSGAIREATEGDAGAVTDLWTAAYVSEGEGGRAAPYSEADFSEAFRRGQMLVAEQGGKVVGVVSLAAPGTPGLAIAQGDEAELSKLVVSASARHLGIGRALVCHCHELARASEWSAIVLWSRHYQASAHRLYESLGYKRLPERDETDESGHERLVLRLAL